MLKPKTYRKKPVHVKAIEFNGNNSKQVEQFIYGESDQKYFCSSPHMTIQTLEGDMKVSRGDYVIKGVAGEFYPCKPDIFKATYEEVDQDGQRVNSTQYPTSPKTAMMTVASVLEWLEGEKEDLEGDRKTMAKKAAGAFGVEVDKQLRIGVTTIETLIEKLTKSTFEQMDEAYGNE